MIAYPSAIADKLAAIDTALAECEASRAYHSAELDRVASLAATKTAIRDAIVETAEICARTGPELPAAAAHAFGATYFDGGDSRGGAVDASEALLPERKRRDIRGEVLTYLKACRCASTSAIALGINAPQSVVERALAYHERDCRVVEKPNGVWQAAVTLPVKDSQPMAVDDLQAAGLSVTEIEHVEVEPQSLLPIEKTPDQVLEFLRRCGSASSDQLRLVHAPASVMRDLRDRELVALGEDGRWRVVAEGNQPPEQRRD